MLYENYRKKIIKVADILKTVRKFRVLIITFLIALLCVMAVLLGIQGVVFDMSTPPAAIVYGQPFEYEAGAVMGSVRYEYAEDGSDEWTAAQPSARLVQGARGREGLRSAATATVRSTALPSNRSPLTSPLRKVPPFTANSRFSPPTSRTAM